MPVAEFLIVKGLIGLGKFIAAKGLVGPVTCAMTKLISTYGLSTVIGGTLVVGFTAGGIYWTLDRVNNLKKGIQALESGDARNAVRHFGRLALSANVSPQLLPDVVHDYLVHINVSEDKAETVGERNCQFRKQDFGSSETIRINIMSIKSLASCALYKDG